MECRFCRKPIGKDNIFCNQSCAASYNNKVFVKRKRVIRFCKNCNKEIPMEKNYKHRKYCNSKCQHEYQWKLKKKEIERKNGVGVFHRSLKKYLLEVRGNKCEICANTKWLNKPIPLILDHVNGNSDDSRLENLRLVCGNCDMQLPTYKSRNFGKGRYYRRKRYLEGKSY